MTFGIYNITKGDYVGPTSYVTKNLAKWYIEGDSEAIKSIINNYKEEVSSGKRPYWLPDLKGILKNNGYEAIDVVEYNIDWD